ncbi:MAG TPA: hypothetical protein VFH95_03855 [Candidatus Kapabacteria bacterium]|nr:hypothetical protein [Candidatus Kapabacteria bacterium]
MYRFLRHTAAYILAASLLVTMALPARAQWSGLVSLGGQATNNVQELDTIAPDRMLMPAFELDYDLHPSAVSTITLTGAYSPEFYSVNPGLSFNETMFGATGVFYLTNQEAITREAKSQSGEEQLNLPHNSHFMEYENNEIDPFHPIRPISSIPSQHPLTSNDSLVDLAVSALYTLSGELDSTDISPKGISKAQVTEFEDLRDSISDVLSTIADLLDSVGYSESTSEVVVGELENIRAPLKRLMPHTKPFHTDPTLLDAAIRFLKLAKPETDFLPTASAPIAPSSVETKSEIAAVQKQAASEETASEEEEEAPPAPRITLIASDTRLREFGYGDVTVHEDADDSDATTLATSLTIPVAYTTHSGVHYSLGDTLLYGGNFGGNPNDSRELTFGGALEGLPSTNFSLRGSYDYTRTAYPFDSVYTNTENRLRLLSRFNIGGPFMLFPEASIGFRNYLTPLTVVDTITPAKGKKTAVVKTLTAGSNFTQFSYGIGTAAIIGERWILGVLVAFNQNPNLRAYVTTAAIARGPKGKTVRAAVQIADDEYTYNLSRYTVFSNARIFWDLDFGADFSYEHRVYGSEVGPKGNTLPGGQGRTENDRFWNLSLSHLFSFDQQLIGAFNALQIGGLLQVSNVNASQSIYTYSATNFTLSATLGF